MPADRAAGNCDVAQWLAPIKPVASPQMRLLCFPYAGGTKHVFARWPDALPSWLDVRALQAPGRGARVDEAPLRRLGDLLEALVPQLPPLFDRPVALFGHSMGAVVAYEIARRLQQMAIPPVHLYVAGCRAPQSSDFDLPPIDASDDELVADLRRQNGTPPELLEMPEVMQLVLPALRADYELLHSYVFVPGLPLSCPLTTLSGRDDCETVDGRADGWRELTANEWKTVTFAGDHFFLRSASEEVLTYLTQSLSDELKTLTPQCARDNARASR